MKRLGVLLIGVILGCNISAQSDTFYMHTYGGIQNDGCRQIQPTPDGGYITIGTTNSYGYGNTSFYAIKTDSLCRFQWSRTYGGRENQEGFSVTNTLDKGYAFVGFTDSYGAGGYDVLLVKTDSMGVAQWQQVYGGSNWDFGYSVKQLSDSGYLIGGLTYSFGSGNGNMYIIRTDKKGNLIWQTTAGGNGYSAANAIAVWEDSLYIIAGASTSYGVFNDTNAILVQINDNGTTEWTKVYGDSTDKSFNSIQITSDKGFLMCGSTDSVPNSTVKDSHQFEFMIKTDTLGNTILNAPGLLPTSDYGIGSDAWQLADNSFVTFGCNSSSGAGELDFVGYSLSAGGWFNAVATCGGSDEEISGSMAIGKNGDIVFGGSTNSYPELSAGLFDVLLVRRVKGNMIVANPGDVIINKYLDTTQWVGAAIPKQQERVGVNIFPNPFFSYATILIQGNDFEKYSYSLYNCIGQCLISNQPMIGIGHAQSKATVERGNLPAGEYYFEVISNGKMKVASGKLIIE